MGDAIKASIGKLALGKPVAQILSTEITDRNIALLSITLDHIDALSRLPSIHRDPFERMLIAQAVVEELTIVTGDQHIKRYAAPCLWD